MKVLFYCPLPFSLAHGGTQTLMEALMQEIAGLGVEVEPLRWWDSAQRGDIIHFMNLPPTSGWLQMAHNQGFRSVMTRNIDQTASRPKWKIALQSACIRLGKKLFSPLANRMGWFLYEQVEASVYVTELERQVACQLFGNPPARAHVVPHGLEATALQSLAQPAPEGDYLICAAVISARKNQILLAQAAKQAKVPIVFIGKPIFNDDPYHQAFLAEVDNRFVRYAGFVSIEEKHRLMREARGFALLSEFESGCIAVYEAAAAGLPLFLTDLPWASTVYGNVENASFSPLSSVATVAPRLAAFYQKAHRLPQGQGEASQTFPVKSWKEVAQCYVAIYEELLATKSR